MIFFIMNSFFKIINIFHDDWKRGSFIALNIFILVCEFFKFIDFNLLNKLLNECYSRSDGVNKVTKLSKLSYIAVNKPEFCVL